MSASLAPKLLSAFIQEVHHHTGISMDAGKQAMLSGRLRRRARALKLDTFGDYLNYLRSTPKEVEHFVDAVTTNKTSMFRTRSVWSYLRETWLPQHLGAGKKFVTAWSAACSSGQEAASLAVTFAESSKADPFRWRITASDISNEMVAAARTQTFPADRIERDAASAPGFDPSPYFGSPTAQGTRQLNAAMRRNMNFKTHNLFDRAPLTRVDLVVVRNVTIYFSPEDKRRVVSRAVDAMSPSGLLIIGESESLVGTRDDLELVDHCIYRRKHR